MRQPSAEDLDAAHQLVESARGERNGTYVPVVDGQPMDEQRGQFGHDVMGNSDRSTHGSEVGDGNLSGGVNARGLGQICR